MDYVREELLRQRRALEALMLGAAEEEREGEEPPPPAEDRLARDAAERRHFPSGVKRDGRTAPLSGTGAAERRLRRGTERPAQERTINRWPFKAEDGAFAVLTQSGARSLSRVIQRDARRYDGGFTIY